MAGVQAAQPTVVLASKANFNYKNGGYYAGQNQRVFSQGRGNPRNGNNRGRGRGGRSNNFRSACQICGKLGHTAAYCWNRYDENFMGSSSQQVKGKQEGSSPTTALTTTVDLEADPGWFMDSGASNHVTNDSNHLR